MILKTLFKLLTNILRFVVMTTILIGCKNSTKDIENERRQVISMLDSFNHAAAKADFNNYFKYFTDDAVFIGTDPTENWNKKNFMIFAKPYFDKGKAWDFKSLERHIYFDKTGNMAWFDELLNTRMKICRGSGVLVKKDKDWKIQQYVLSVTIPNSQIDSVIKIKASIEDSIIRSFTNK